MNWTGGTLQRTKHANNGVIQKQKAYFARARTQLQHSPGAPAVPFRPEYLQDVKDCETDQRFPSFVPGLVHRDMASHQSPTMQISRRQSNPQDADPPFPHSIHTSRADELRPQERESHNANADIEITLLEANKKRLLRQQDWVGFAPSRPVEMRLTSIKKLSRVGRRRKLDSKSKAQTRRHGRTPSRYGFGRNESAGQGDSFMSGALPVLTAADNIRIRIGSEALTTAASTQPRNYARSQTNSDSMLFNKEGEDAARRTESEVPRGTFPTSQALTANPTSPDFPSARSYKSYSLHQDTYAHGNLTNRPDLYADEHAGHNTAGLATVDQSDHRSEAADTSYRLTHHMRGVERSLKITFDGRSASITTPLASPSHLVSELQRDHAGLHAEESKIRHESRKVNERSQFGIGRHLEPPPTDDDEPWRPYLDTGTSSSGDACVADGTEASVPQHHIPARNTRAGRTSFIANSNLTHVNLLKVSASWPAVDRRGGQHSDTRSLPWTNNAKREVNEDEAFWQSYILGSDPPSAIETIHTHNETSEDSMSRATEGYASTRPPFSNVVNPVSSTPYLSTPYQSLSGQASRMSEDAQHTTHSESRSITSAAPYGVWCGVESPSQEDVQDVDQGEDTSGRSHFGEQSTHASMQNHASHSSAMLSDTQTSRSDLDQRSRAWENVSRRAQASGSVVWQRDRDSSIWDIPSSS